MKRDTFVKTGLLVAAMLTITACGDFLERSENGDFDGNWHMEYADTLSTGGRLELKNEYVFWAVQGKLMTFSGATKGAYVCEFTLAGDSLVLGEMHSHDRSHGDPLLNNVEQMAPYGISELSEHFKVEQLKSGKMVLRSKKLRLGFKKL